MSNPLKPSLTLLVKLGSIAIHVEEARSKNGHAFDVHAIDALMADPEVVEWRTAMDALALLPRKR